MRISRFWPALGFLVVMLPGAVVIGPSAQAEELDQASQAALLQTQQMLSHESERLKALEGNSLGKAVDAQVRALAGDPLNTNAVYQLAGDIFADLVKESGGDVAKLTEIVNQGKKNPQSLESHMSPENRAKLNSLVGRIQSAPIPIRKPASQP